MRSNEYFNLAHDGPSNRSEADIEKDAKSPDRQRGMWSFLTWSFFLGQVLAAEGLLGRSASAADAPDGSETQSVADAAGLKNAALAALGSVAPGAEPGLAQSAQPTLTVEKGSFAGDGSTNDFQPGQMAVDGLPALSSGTAAGGEGEASFGEWLDSASAVADGDVAGLVPTPGANGPGFSVDPSVIVSPTITIDLGLSLPDILGDATAGVGQIVDGLLNTTSDLLDGLLAADGVITGTLNSLTSLPLIEQTTGSLANLVGDVTETVGALPIVGGVVSTVTSALPQLAGDTGLPLIGGLLAGGDGSADVGSPGVLAFASTPLSNVLNPDTLFDQGRYTDLNIAMRTNEQDDGGGASSGVASQISSLLGGDDHGSDTDDGPSSEFANILPAISDTARLASLDHLFA